MVNFYGQPFEPCNVVGHSLTYNFSINLAGAVKDYKVTDDSSRRMENEPTRFALVAFLELAWLRGGSFSVLPLSCL